jgi:hypothetical protein
MTPNHHAKRKRAAMTLKRAMQRRNGECGLDEGAPASLFTAYARKDP